ncbi:MAG: hypothetical protein ACRDGD_06515 [Candidatus Limnocylindria bacterium]
MDAPACAVGRLGPDGPWVGFAPALEDAYAIVVGLPSGATRREVATRDELLTLALAYFEEALDGPPDELAAMHGDIGALVRHVAEHESEPERRRAIDEAVDAIDDGLAVDVVIARLGRALPMGADPLARLDARAREILGESA